MTTNLNRFNDTLGFLAWPELYVPVRILPNGDFTFFLHQGQIMQFLTVHVCLGYLRGVARVDAAKAA